MIRILSNMFSRTTPIQLVQQELKEEQMNLVKAHSIVEHNALCLAVAKLNVTSHQERIARLQQHVDEHTKNDY